MQDSGAAAWRITAWWIAFGATHILLSSQRLRPVLVAKLGERRFLGLYSFVALATFIPLVSTYAGARHAGAALWSFGLNPLARIAAIVIGMVAFALLVASFVQPSPAGMDPRAATGPHGVTRITRHPMLAAFALWAIAHLIVNGYATDVAFFGGMVVYSLAGALHQDARKRATRGEELAELYRESSLIPFAAIVAGRGRLVAAELPWSGLAAGAIAGYAIYALHPFLFG